MAVLFFSLRGVPDDEAEDVRELLLKNNIDFYETSEGNWGISMPALWLKNDDDQQEARNLLAAYQIQRCVQQRAIYQQMKQEGKHKRLWDTLRERPLQFLIYNAFIILILYLSYKLLVELGL